VQEEKSVEAKQQKIGSKSSEAKATKKFTFGFFDAKRISISGSLKSKKLN